VVNGCTLLGLTEESDFSAWEAAMGSDPVHLTDAALGTVACQLCEMAEGNDAMFSGGKRALEDRPAPIIQGRKPWVYGPSQGRGGREGRGGRGGARGGFPSGGYGARGYSSSGSGYGGYNNSGYGNSGYGNKKR